MNTNFDQEIARLSAELKKNPNNEKAKKAKSVCLNNKALSLSTKSKNEEAIKIIKQAIELDPLHSVLYCNLANLYTRMSKYNEAIESASKALDVDPHNHNAIEILSLNLNNQYTIDNQKGNHEEALKKITRALELKPHDKIFLFNKASLLNKLGRHEEAIITIEQSLVIDPNFPNGKSMKSIILNQLSLGDSDKQQYEEALCKINQAIELKSNEIGFFINKATYLINLNRIDEASQATEKAFALDKNSKDAKNLKDIIAKRKQ